MKLGLFGSTSLVLLIIKTTGAADISWLTVIAPLLVPITFWLCITAVASKFRNRRKS